MVEYGVIESNCIEEKLQSIVSSLIKLADILRLRFDDIIR